VGVVTTQTAAKPVIALVLGDPAGIGPEIVAKLLALREVRDAAGIFVIGDRDELERGRRIAGVEFPLSVAASFDAADFSLNVPALLQFRGSVKKEFPRAMVSAQGGRYCLETLEVAVELARSGKVGAVCFAPLNKSSLHAAGIAHNDELHWFAEKLGHRGPCCEFNVLGALWTSRVTSHMPLKDVSGRLTPEKVAEAIALIHGALLRAGVAAPRIAVCGFNPHNGDNGAFGREEIDIIAPGIALAGSRGQAADGAYPADTIFLKARAGAYDAVVTMYHDQGQIALKLMGFDRGVTVQGGLPIAITTPAHGTAFDIVGQGKADVGAMKEAFMLACRMARSRRDRA
jgi:4-hydroxythreonine-4-phosphate dehydrogenase